MADLPNPWLLRAAGGGEMVADPVEVRRALGVFADPDGYCQLVSLKSGAAATRPGRELDELVEVAKSLPSGFGVYFQINPVRPGLATKAKKADVTGRRWLFIDIDPVKAEAHKDDSATDAEKNRAGDLCHRVWEHLSGLGWPAPVVTDSGNGFGLFYRCDLPNDELVRAAYKRLLETLSGTFSGPDGGIDKAVHNADRLAKLPGTWAKKGVPSDDRPHRVCRLVMVPREIESVAFELLAATAGAGGEKEGTAPAPVANGHHKIADGKGASAYVRKALENECGRVALTATGGRNNALNKAAYNLGGLVAGGHLNEADVCEALYAAACSAGLDRDPDCGESGIRSTVASGLRAGKDSPRDVPARNDPKPVLKGATAAKKSDGRPARLTVKLSAVEAKKVDWLVPKRIPKRFVTVFAGRTGIGKSFVALDLIARLTVGAEIPGAGGECFEPSGALILSEDSHEYVLAPRLMGLGADLSRVNAMTWEAMAKYHLGDTEMLGEACDEVEGGVSLVLIDPPTNFLDDTDEHKNSEVRQLVMKVVAWAFSRDLAVLFVLHVNKSTGKGIEALNRVMGSVAWVSTARVAHAFCLDPNDQTRGLWVPTKSNLGKMPKGLAYRITEAETVEWLGEIDMSADEAMSAEPKKQKREIVAMKWLVERFREKLEWKSEDLFEAAEEEGISRNAVFDAKKMLKLPKARQDHTENGAKRWIWCVPKDWPPLTKED